MLCCVMLLIVGEPKQLNEETPIRGPEIRRERRAECSHEVRQHQADNHGASRGFIEASLANIQFEFKQAQTYFDWPKGGLNKTKSIGESQNMPDVF